MEKHERTATPEEIAAQRESAYRHGAMRGERQAQPSEPECVSEPCPRCGGYSAHTAECKAISASEPERVSDVLDLDELWDKHSEVVQLLEDGGDYRSVIKKRGFNGFKSALNPLLAELRTLRVQLAEKEAAIEKARRDALEEAAKVADREWAKHDDVPRCATAIRIERAIRALATQKKEG